MTPSDAHRNPTVDLVRVSACLLVLAHHAAQHLPDHGSWEPVLRGLLLCGNSGVQIFFVLSGFLLAEPFWRAYLQDQKGPSLGTYALRRLARIAPGFWLNLTLCFVLSLILPVEGGFLVERYIAGMTFTSGLSWVTMFPTELNGPLWSIGFEVFSYALLGALGSLWFWFSRKRSLWAGLFYWFVVLALALVVHVLLLTFGMTDGRNRGWSFGLLGGAKEWWPFYNPVGFFGVFVIGILACGLASGLRTGVLRASEKARKGFLAVGLLVVLLSYLGYGWLGPYGYGMSLPAMPYMFPSLPVGIALILVSGSAWSRRSRLARARPIQTLADLSYGLYLWHYLTMTMVLRGFFLEEPSDGGTWFLEFGLIYAIAFGVAWLSWHGLEKRILSWAHGRGTGAGGAPSRLRGELLVRRSGNRAREGQ